MNLCLFDLKPKEQEPLVGYPNWCMWTGFHIHLVFCQILTRSHFPWHVSSLSCQFMGVVNFMTKFWKTYIGKKTLSLPWIWHENGAIWYFELNFAIILTGSKSMPNLVHTTKIWQLLYDNGIV